MPYKPVLNSIIIGILLAALGCNGKPTPVAVSGTVSYEGRPLESGQLQFEPLSGPQTQRRDATISKGDFQLAADQGLLPGTEFKVLIKAFKKTGRQYPNVGASFDEEIQYLPEKYNVSTTLRATISADESQNHLKFDLLSK